MRAVRAALPDRPTPRTVQTLARASKAATDDRFHHVRVSVAAPPQAQAVRKLQLQAVPRNRESFGCPTARASLKSPPRDPLPPEPESRPAPRVATLQGVLLHSLKG